MSVPFDEAAFANPEFNVKAWINASLKPSTPKDDHLKSPTAQGNQSGQQPTLEQETALLVTRLQMASDTISRKVTMVTDSVIKSMPRMVYDLKLITADAQATKRGVDQVRQHLKSDHSNDTESALEKLRKLHIVKTRMEQCCAALREAENWNNLENEANQVLAKQDYEAAATRLQSAKQSLDVFQHSPEYGRRQQLLSKLQGDLESALRPKVLEALQSHDAAECHRYYKVFSRIERADDFVDLYFETRNPALMDSWREANSKENLVDALDVFYKSVYSVIAKEYVWCASIFPDPKMIVQALVQHILQALDPSIADRLASVATHQTASALPILVDAFVVTEAFGLTLERLFSKPPVNTASTDHSSAPRPGTATHARRRSSLSQLTLVPLTLRHADSNAWSYVLYVPFLPFQSQYASLEGQYLKTQLRGLIDHYGFSSKNPPLTDLAHIVANEVADKAFSIAKEALHRCVRLTHGFGTIEWFRSVNGYIGDATKQLIQLLQTIRANTQAGDGSNASPQRIASPDEDDLDLEADEGDWTAFQAGLSLLAVCRALDNQLDNFQSVVSQTLENVRGLIQEKETEETGLASPVTPSVSTFSDGHHYHHHTRPALERRRSADRRRSGVLKEQSHHGEAAGSCPKASLALLRTSRLNSHELQRVVSQVSSVAEEGHEHVVQAMFKEASQHICDLRKECQAFVHECVQNPIVRHLANIPTMTNIWMAKEHQQRKQDGDATTDVDVPQFSTSPSEYITRVGEQLLMLPQQFEVYADSNSALAYRVETIPFMQQDDDFDGQDDDNSHTIQLWTTCVARGVMASLLSLVKKIPQKSPQGRRQLHTDIQYFIKVLSALDVQPLQELIDYSNTSNAS